MPLTPHQDASPRPRLLGWVAGYQRSWLPADLIAGITVAALVVPKSLGYAGIASVPIQHGLFAAAAGALIYALLGSSRQVAAGPSSALATVAGSAVVLSGVKDNQAIQIVMAVTLISGIAYLLLALFRMGWISQFLSHAVITGFLFGAAIDVIIGEAHKITGTKASGDNSWQELASWVQSIDQTQSTTLWVGLIALVVIFGLHLVDKRIPGALVLVIGGILASRWLDLGAKGVELVGTVPQGLPKPVLPEWNLIQTNWGVIGTASLGLLLIGFSQTAGSARAMATRHQYQVDMNQESTAMGMANVGSALAQGIPVSASLSASSLNDSAGARSPLASITTGVTVVFTLLFLAPVFSALPEAVLAALIIEAVVFGMMDVREFHRLWHVKREDFWIAFASAMAVLSGGVLAGVAVGVALSIVWLLRAVAQPVMPEVGQVPDTNRFVSFDENPKAASIPGVAVLRFDGDLYFATADALTDRLRQIVDDGHGELHHIVLDLQGVNFIDSQGSATIEELTTLAADRKLTLDLARVKGSVMAVLEADGIVDQLGAQHFHLSTAAAVESATGA